VFIDDEQANKRLSKPMRSPWRFETPMRLRNLYKHMKTKLSLALALLAGWVVGPSLRAASRMDRDRWRVGIYARSFPQATFFEAVDKTVAAGREEHRKGTRAEGSAPRSPDFDWNLAGCRDRGRYGRSCAPRASPCRPITRTIFRPVKKRARKLFQFAKTPGCRNHRERTGGRTTGGHR